MAISYIASALEWARLHYVVPYGIFEFIDPSRLATTLFGLNLCWAEPWLESTPLGFYLALTIEARPRPVRAQSCGASRA
uniref:Uncharacterized protein n=1 Tax=Cucumis melo TaxID=3656 RepID=A0A9I9CQ04_CUCME